jgi:hypothetical protein
VSRAPEELLTGRAARTFMPRRSASGIVSTLVRVRASRRVCVISMRSAAPSTEMRVTIFRFRTPAAKAIRMMAGKARLESRPNSAIPSPPLAPLKKDHRADTIGKATSSSRTTARQPSAAGGTLGN